MARFRLPCRVLLAAGLAGAGRAAEPADVPVALPPFLVEEATKGPPWRYGQAMGYEILSRCDEATTRRVVEAHHRLHQLLEEILPVSLQLTWTVPRTMILYDEELQPAASQEVVARLLRGKPEVPPVELEAPGGRGWRTTIPARKITFLPNLRLSDSDGMAVFMIVRRDGFDANRLSLTHDYISFLVKRRVPQLPAWFVSGFLDLYREITFESDALEAEPLRWISEESTDAVKKDPKTAPAIAPLEAFFAGAIVPVDAAGYSPLQAWRAQAALFVRWGLDGRAPGRRARFQRFVAQAATRGESEELFRECLGFDYAAAQAELATFLPTAVGRPARYRPARMAKLPAFATQPASDAQIARIKGDWERLEVPFVKAVSPELTAKYLEQARRTLRRGCERAPGDPQLLAVLGLCEVDAGDASLARDLLERAAQLGPLRPRANLELARLRLEAARREAADAGGRLGVARLAEVLAPLFATRAMQPPLPEVYDTIAEAWAASAVQPTRGHLAVLDEGVRLFPRRIELVLRAAELNLRHGFRADAGRLLDVAAGLAADEAAKARVAALEIELASR